MSRFLWKAVGIGVVVVQYGCIAHVGLNFVGDFVVCSGPSMQPTINSSDIVLTEHLTVFSQQIERGDVVIARSPSNPRQYICKRVIGMAGDYIETHESTYSYKYVPRGHVWLEGDNSQNSTDSRTYGAVPYGLLRSRVFFKIWPPSQFGSIHNNSR